MHAAAMKPKAATTAELDTALVEKERGILTEQARKEGKPENIIGKMIEGRMRNFYAEHVLAEQPFVKDDKQTDGKVAAAGGMNQVSQTNYRGYDEEIFDMVTNQSYQVTEQSLDMRYGAAYGATAGGSSYSTIVRKQYHQQTSVSYVTGSHNFKTGLNFRKFVTGVSPVFWTSYTMRITRSASSQVSWRSIEMSFMSQMCCAW